MKKTTENKSDQKLGDKVVESALNVVGLVAAVLSPEFYIGLGILAVKKGLNALDDIINNQPTPVTPVLSSENNNISIESTFKSQEELEQIQADHDLAVLLSGDNS